MELVVGGDGGLVCFHTVYGDKLPSYMVDENPKVGNLHSFALVHPTF